LQAYSADIPAGLQQHLRQALECLVRFAEKTGDAAQLAAWRQKLAELDQPRQVASF